MTPLHPWLRRLEPVVHGGAAQWVRAGLDPAELVDLSATTLPGGPLPGVAEAIAALDVARYPDPHAHALHRAVAARWKLDPSSLLAANGSVSLIRAIARAVLRPGETSLIAGPTFGEYAQAVRLAGAHPEEFVRDALPAVTRSDSRLVWFCDPNNPTGERWSPSEVLSVVQEDRMVVVDEAYAGFLQPEPRPRVWPGVVRLRSWTKDRGLAGLRLGFAIGEPDVLRVLAEVLDPWAVSAVAQVAGVAAASETAEVELQRRLTELWQRREVLVGELLSRGLTLNTGSAPYFTMEVPCAAAATAALAGEGVLVRDCSSFGMPRQVRISPRTEAAHQRLLAAIDAHRSTVTL